MGLMSENFVKINKQEQWELVYNIRLNSILHLSTSRGRLKLNDPLLGKVDPRVSTIFLKQSGITTQKHEKSND